MTETVTQQVDRLAQTILEVCPEQIRDEGAVDVAIRIIRGLADPQPLPQPPASYTVGENVDFMYRPWVNIAGRIQQSSREERMTGVVTYWNGTTLEVKVESGAIWKLTLNEPTSWSIP